jgi:hypothetical protein
MMKSLHYSWQIRLSVNRELAVDQTFTPTPIPGRVIITDKIDGDP